MATSKQTLLHERMKKVWARPMVVEHEEMLIDFLDLQDVEQKSVLFRELVILNERLEWIKRNFRRIER